MVVIAVGAVELLIKSEPPVGYHKLLGLLWRHPQALVAGFAVGMCKGCGIEVKYPQNVGVNISYPNNMPSQHIGDVFLQPLYLGL